MLSDDDAKCEQHFVNTTTRNHDGRFIVRIPLKFNPLNLGDSKQLATKRLNNLHTKNTLDPNYKLLYIDFMNEYKELNHMTQVKNIDHSKIYYFLPHHGILRENSLTTKMRVVFNGSAITSSGWSVNDLQYTGPTIQNDIFNILLRFRQRRYVITADIEKMYRQIEIHSDDRNLQHILWSEGPNEPINIFALNTITYGTKSAPYLAIRCIKQLGKENQNIYPDAANIILNDFYVDDLITSFDSKVKAIQTCKQIIQILDSAKFPLRKWVSNDPTITSTLSNSNDPINSIRLGDNQKFKTLGILWSGHRDILTYEIPRLHDKTIITKRVILSDVAKIFDPLGLLSPCIILAKIIIQKLWLNKLDWDDETPDLIKNQWINFQKNLPILEKLEIQRHITCKKPTNIQIHGFCDASQKAYGACIYVRSINATNEIQTHLLCAKTKVAPLKILTIPRLELCSALLLAKLYNKVKHALSINASYYLWSDSTIVLSWLHNHPSKLQTFVANRICEIQNTTNVENWRHVKSKQNPADLCSRGAFPDSLQNSHLWWFGPSW